VRVPPGTVVDDAARGARWELLSPGQRAVVARGGPGGRGNRQFATATRQTPRFAERGLPGDEGWLDLQLRLLADAGLVGLPNAGKSSLLARMTRAHPKVADYPFTTLEPVLGTIDADERQLVLADIPGLIEGAHEGAGLGDRFLGHIERCRVLLHLVEGTSEHAGQAYKVVRRELEAYGHGLAEKPEIVALSKADALDEDTLKEQLARLKRAAKAKPFVLSSASGRGVQEVLRAVHSFVDTAKQDDAPAEAPGEWRP
jgi:GTP-binding protein